MFIPPPLDFARCTLLGFVHKHTPPPLGIARGTLLGLARGILLDFVPNT